MLTFPSANLFAGWSAAHYVPSIAQYAAMHTPPSSRTIREPHPPLSLTGIRKGGGPSGRMPLQTQPTPMAIGITPPCSLHVLAEWFVRARMRRSQGLILPMWPYQYIVVKRGDSCSIMHISRHKGAVLFRSDLMSHAKSPAESPWPLAGQQPASSPQRRMRTAQRMPSGSAQAARLIHQAGCLHSLRPAPAAARPSQSPLQHLL